jgi:tetratricopeptide (TPR) repeat protein
MTIPRESGPGGTIATFYSYKGGTGRTMALANVGWILASSGSRVLMIDWDLEGPGLEHYFAPFLPPAGESDRGLIDFFWDAASYATDPLKSDADAESASAPDLLTMAEPVRYRFPNSGGLEIIRPGRQDQLFGARVQDFNWRHFYENLGGSRLLDGLRERLKFLYDWVLIDSRTGLSDTSGICTVKMPDVVVNCFVPNLQSIEGARAVAESVAVQGKKTIRILPLPCRIENSEHVLLNQARALWRRRHQEFLDEATASTGYWSDVEVPYRPAYAFGESLACLVDTPGLVDTVLAACERLVSHLTHGAVTQLIQPTEETSMALAVRADAPARVFISYAHDNEAHRNQVREFWLFLRANGIDARLDLSAAEKRTDWPEWLTEQVRDADFILVIASPQYRLNAEGDGDPGTGRGVQWEARHIRQRLFDDQQAGLWQILPVVLPQGSASDLPLWLVPASALYYKVNSYTPSGAEMLLRVLTRQPREGEQLGSLLTLPVRDTNVGTTAFARPSLRTELVIESKASDTGQLASTAWLAGACLGSRSTTIPAEVSRVWTALQLPPEAAAERMADAGRRLAAAMFDDATDSLLGEILRGLPAGERLDVTLAADQSSLSLPVELLRLSASGHEVGPLGLLPGISVSRRPAVPSQGGGPSVTPAVPPLPGPLKVLVAIAAPDETKTGLPPLDSEAEMQAVLEGATAAAGGSSAQIRILEVASLPTIRDALQSDAYHVLHLSAHGRGDYVELEDEDGRPVQVSSATLAATLREAGRPMPLIVLSTCADMTMAKDLIAQGANRVITMLGPVTDAYAITLARHFYRLLAAAPAAPAAQILSLARIAAEEERSRETRTGKAFLPEYGIATLLTVDEDGPLVDLDAIPQPLTVATQPTTGRSIRELPVGALIGRRAELRTALRVLRRDPAAVRQFGASSGVLLTGIGGIGKTALAGRIMSRLREEGWLVVVHEGRWNPTSLISATASALGDSPGFSQAVQILGDPAVDDTAKLALLTTLLRSLRLVLVLDDFEQNLTTGGSDFLDLAAADALSELADAAETGALLITCRYPIPGRDLFLTQIPVPGLSPAELRRMFLRLPALAELDPGDQRLLMRTIGGHPRLIEFVDALLRGGRSNLRLVQTRLRGLAREQGIDLRAGKPVSEAAAQAMMLGSADILLDELLAQLTRRQANVLAQVSVCRAPLTIDDLAYALGWLTVGEADDEATVSERPDLAELQADAYRLAELTLIEAGHEITMHPWTADLVSRHIVAGEATALHERALGMRLRRFEQERGTYEDLLEIPGHLAVLQRYDDIIGIAYQAVRILPGTLATVAYLSEIPPLIPPDQRAWVLAADLEYQALLNAGNLPAARRQLQAIHQRVQARAAADPANTEWQRDLSVAHSRLGDAATAAGDLTTARSHYQASLDIRVRLAAADPANPQWQRDLSMGYSRLGDIAASAGDLTTARSHYQASLDITARLTAADPANTDWQRDLSVSLNKLGATSAAAGDLTAALSLYQASLDIRTRLAATDPTNAEWQRDLSVSHDRLGDAATAAGDPTTARSHYQASLDIRVRLAAADPANPQWQRDLGLAQQKLDGVNARETSAPTESDRAEETSVTGGRPTTQAQDSLFVADNQQLTSPESDVAELISRREEPRLADSVPALDPEVVFPLSADFPSTSDTRR